MYRKDSKFQMELPNANSKLRIKNVNPKSKELNPKSRDKTYI